MWSSLWEPEARVGGWILRSAGRLAERPWMKGFRAGSQGINDAIVTGCPELSESKSVVGHCCSYHIQTLEHWVLSAHTYGGKERARV